MLSVNSTNTELQRSKCLGILPCDGDFYLQEDRLIKGTLLDIMFDDIYRTVSNNLIVKSGKNLGMLDSEGNELLACIYENIYITDKLAIATGRFYPGHQPYYKNYSKACSIFDKAQVPDNFRIEYMVTKLTIINIATGEVIIDAEDTCNPTFSKASLICYDCNTKRALVLNNKAEYRVYDEVEHYSFENDGHTRLVVSNRDIYIDQNFSETTKEYVLSRYKMTKLKPLNRTAKKIFNKCNMVDINAFDYSSRSILSHSGGTVIGQLFNNFDCSALLFNFSGDNDASKEEILESMCGGRFRLNEILFLITSKFSGNKFLGTYMIIEDKYYTVFINPAGYVLAYPDTTTI